MKVLGVLLILGVLAQKQCTSHADCQFAGAGALCDFSKSSQEGLCKAIDGTFPVEPPKSCNGTITTACPIGQICIDGFCSTAKDAANRFFTPTIIALFIAGAVLLCCGGGLLFCCCCNLCCFATKKAGGAATATAKAPFKLLGRKRPTTSRQQYEPAPQRPTQMEVPPKQYHPPERAGPPAPVAGPLVSNSTTANKIPSSGNHDPSVYRQNPRPPQNHATFVEEIIEIIPHRAPAYNAPQNPYNNVPEYIIGKESSAKLFESHARPTTKQANKSLAMKNDNNSSVSKSDILWTPTVGANLSDSVNPPKKPGFFGFWDPYGRYHQGYRDENLRIHGGVFDDHEFFHFGKFGSSEPVTVEDEMMAQDDDETDASTSVSQRIYRQNTNRPHLQIEQDRKIVGSSQMASPTELQSPRLLTTPMPEGYENIARRTMDEAADTSN